MAAGFLRIERRAKSVKGGLRRAAWPIAAALALAVATPAASGAARNAAGPQTPGAPRQSSELFQPNKVWNIQLTFSQEQWDLMEPKGGGFGGPGGPGGRGGPMRFGPGMFLAPALLQQADADKDGKLSQAEFHALGEKWFAQWDKKQAGSVDEDQLRDGLTESFTPPPGAPGGPGGPRPGGPGGGPGMMLQGQEGKRNGLASAAGVEFKFVHADFDIEGQTLSNVGVRYKGNGTWMQSQGSLKKSMKIDFDHFDSRNRLAGVRTINLHSCVTDASYMNEVLSHQLYRDAHVPASHTSFARVYITVPGKFDHKYLGLYSIIEDVDRSYFQENYQQKRGGVLKPVTPAPFTDLGDKWSKYNQTYDPKGHLSAEQEQRIIDFCKLVSHADDAEFADQLGEYLDIDEFARYMAVTVWLSTLDSILTIGQNYYVYLNPDTNKLQFMPWDLDHSFGNFPMGGSQDQREKLSLKHPWRGEIRFLERVFAQPEFEKRYFDYLKQFSETIFQPQRFHQQVDAMARAIRPAVVDESPEKLTRFDAVVAGKPVEPAGFPGFGGPRREGGSGGPPPGGPAENGPGGPPPGGPADNRPGGSPPGGPEGGRPPFMPFMQAPKPIKGFVDARVVSVAEQLAGKSEGLKLEEFGGPGGPPGGPGRGPGGPGGPMRGGPGGPRFGAGMFIGPLFMNTFDADKDKHLTREELSAGLDNWFAKWDAQKTGTITEEQLRNGLNEVMMPPGGGFGPPGGGPRPQPVIVPLGGPAERPSPAQSDAK